MGNRNSPKLLVLLVCCLIALAQASEEDDVDHYNHHRYPLAGHPLRDDVPGDERQAGSTQSGSTPQATVPPYTVSSLTEAITLAVMSGICGPSLFALLGCWVRQVRLTWDDPFAGGERPVDEAAERRKRKKEQRQQQQQLQGDGIEEDEEEPYVSNNFPGANVVKNKFDPMNLDNVVSLDLDKIRARPLLTAKYSNTEKNLAGRVNVGYSKTAEDIM